MRRKRIVAITGGSSGIGAAVARYVAEMGVSPIILDTDQEGAERVLSGLTTEVEGKFIQTDISDHTSIVEAARRIGEWTTGLDGVVASAGVLSQGRADTYSVADWTRTFDVNVRGVWLTVRETYPMLCAARGTVIAVGSIHAQATRPGYSAYASSKAAVAALVQGMAVDFSEDGVRVLGVAPSGVDTPLTRRAFEQLDPAEREAVLSRYPLGRLAKADEIAEVIGFLLFSASYMTGTTVNVDGGVLASL